MDGSSNIIELPKEFDGKGEVRGMLFTRVWGNLFYYIYKVEQDGHINYEVITRELVPVCLDFANKIYSTTHFKEKYPKANLFGTKGWTYASFAKALEKAFSLTGEYYGYPECCIKEFADASVERFNIKKEGKENCSGFIPCKRHAIDIVSGKTTLTDLVDTNKRKETEPFQEVWVNFAE